MKFRRRSRPTAAADTGLPSLFGPRIDGLALDASNRTRTREHARRRAREAAAAHRQR